MSENSTPTENRDKYKDHFLQLLYDDEIEKVKQLVNDKITWIAFTLDDSYMWKLDEDNSFLAEVIRTNNIFLIDYFINLPQYKIHPEYFSTISHYVAYGFKAAAAGDNLNALEYYESLHINLEMDKLGDDCGLNKATWEKENGKLLIHKYIFKDALQNAIDSDYPEGDIIDFIICKKDKYHSDDCTLTVSDMITQLDEESLHYNKFDTIRKHLGYEYNTKLFNDIYNIVKNDPRIHPSIVYLVLEKDLPYDDEIKQLLKDDVRTANVFLYRKLEDRLEVKDTSNKLKL